jgi:hypothetical protein
MFIKMRDCEGGLRICELSNGTTSQGNCIFTDTSHFALPNKQNVINGSHRGPRSHHLRYLNLYSCRHCGTSHFALPNKQWYSHSFRPIDALPFQTHSVILGSHRGILGSDRGQRSVYPGYLYSLRPSDSSNLCPSKQTGSHSGQRRKHDGHTSHERLMTNSSAHTFRMLAIRARPRNPEEEGGSGFGVLDGPNR